MLLSWFIEVPIGISLGVVALLLAGSIGLSFLWPAPADDVEPHKKVRRAR